MTRVWHGGRLDRIEWLLHEIDLYKWLYDCQAAAEDPSSFEESNRGNLDDNQSQSRKRKHSSLLPGTCLVDEADISTSPRVAAVIDLGEILDANADDGDGVEPRETKRVRRLTNQPA